MRPFVWSPARSAEETPDRVAVAKGEETTSYANLVALAGQLLAGLREKDVRPGSLIGTDIPPSAEFFALALAVLQGGFGLLPISSAYSDSERRALLMSAGATHDIRGTPGAGRQPYITLHFDDLIGATSATGRHAERSGWISYVTSATTGRPTVVASHRPWYAYRGVAVLPKYGAGPERGPHVMANPTFHLGTLGPALYALQAGSTVVVQERWSPHEFAELVDRHAADSAFLSPDQLVALVDAGKAPCRRLEVVFHGGSHCPHDVKRAGIDLLGPVLHEYYGTSHGVISEITSVEWLARPGSAGQALPGVVVTIEEDGRPVAPGRPGEICVRFRPTGRDDGIAVRTGDLGRLDEDGYLFVTGRLPDSGNQEVPLLEAFVRELPGVLDVALVETDGGIWCAAELNAAADRPALQKTVLAEAARRGLPPLSISFESAGELSRTASGKLRRVPPPGESPGPHEGK